MNTRSRIILLVVLAALPALALTGYSTWDERVRAEADTREELTRLATLAAQRQGQIVEGAKQTLVAISLLPPAILQDPARCHEYLAKLLEKSSGIYHSMGVYDPDNVLACNAVPWQGRIVAPDRLYLKLARSTGGFAIGEYQVGRVTGRQGINFAYPVTDAAGAVTGLAFVAVSLADLNRMAASTPLPAHSLLTVVDRNALILARHPESAGRIGQALRNPRVVEALNAGSKGTLRATGTDGVDRLFAYDVVAVNPDRSVPIRVLISIPMNVIFAEADRAFVRNLAGIALVILVLLIAAWYGAEIFVLRKVRVLIAAAGRVHSGDLSARTGLRHDGEELSQVGEAFDRMTEALQRRDEELKRALQDLQEQAITDPLTGLLNRRYLREYLPRELLRGGRSGAALAVIMMDLDHFKRVNDTCGHDAGDMVLREVGALLRNNIRASDIACRYGGEEFALVLPEATAEGAQQRAEALRASIASLNLKYGDRALDRITASFGIALSPGHADDADGLVRAADAALYRAKRNGRDRVEMSDARAATPERLSRRA